MGLFVSVRKVGIGKLDALWGKRGVWNMESLKIKMKKMVKFEEDMECCWVCMCRVLRNKRFTLDEISTEGIRKQRR